MIQFQNLLFIFLIFESDALMVPPRQITPLNESFDKRIPKSLPVVTPELVNSFVPYHMGPYGSQMIPLTSQKLDGSDWNSQTLRFEKKIKFINKVEKYQSGISSLNRLHFNRLTFDD